MGKAGGPIAPRCLRRSEGGSVDRETTTCASQSGSRRRARLVGGQTSPPGAAGKTGPCPWARERVGDPGGRPSSGDVGPWVLLHRGSVRGRDFRSRGWGRRNPRKGEPSPNGLIAIAALAGRAQQGFMHLPGNAPVLIEGPAAEFQLQHLPSFAVDHRREGGRGYGGKAQARFLPGVARKSGEAEQA